MFHSFSQSSISKTLGKDAHESYKALESPARIVSTEEAGEWNICRNLEKVMESKGERQEKRPANGTSDIRNLKEVKREQLPESTLFWTHDRRS
jgi:hypothetical protein